MTCHGYVTAILQNKIQKERESFNLLQYNAVNLLNKLYFFLCNFLWPLFIVHYLIAFFF